MTDSRAGARLSRRNLRLASGLTLFAYATLHLVNHAIGLHSLAAAEAALRVAVRAWTSAPGTVPLYGAAAIHVGLAFLALYERRTLRMPPIEALRYLLGFSIPLVLVGHTFATRVVTEMGGSPTYERVVWAIFQGEREWRQFVLVTLVWVHGSIGVALWLRHRPWFPRVSHPLLSVAVLLPVLALAGFVSMGRELEAMADEPAFKSAQEAYRTELDDAQRRLLEADRDGWLGAFWLLLGGVVVARGVRRVVQSRRHSFVTMRYPDSGGARPARLHGARGEPCGRDSSPVAAAAAARAARPAACASRRRRALPPPGEDEAAHARPHPRAARCAARVPDAARGRRRRRAGVRRATARTRPSGRAASSARWSCCSPTCGAGPVSRSARCRSTWCTCRTSSTPRSATPSRDGWRPAQPVRRRQRDGDLRPGVRSSPRPADSRSTPCAASRHGMREVNRRMHKQFEHTLDFGIGLNAGPAVIGEVGWRDTRTVSAVGDTVNTAARLQELTKSYRVRLVLADAVAAGAGLPVRRAGVARDRGARTRGAADRATPSRAADLLPRAARRAV